jgi:hypothetical protein
MTRVGCAVGHSPQPDPYRELGACSERGHSTVTIRSNSPMPVSRTCSTPRRCNGLMTALASLSLVSKSVANDSSNPAALVMCFGGTIHCPAQK